MSGRESNISEEGEYRFTPDRNFAIKPVPPGEEYIAEFQTTSDFLFVKSDYELKESPLKKMIEKKIFVSEKENGAEQHLTIGDSQYIQYRFFRKLIDNTKDKNRDPDNIIN